MHPEVVFVTENQIKLEEAGHLLGYSRSVRWPFIEEQHVDPVDVVRSKLAQVQVRVGPRSFVVVEDTGLAIEPWNGLPGALVRSFVDRLGPDGLAGIVPPNARATARSAVAVATSDATAVWHADVHGRIVAPRGSLGGWTPIFEVDGFRQTLAEMTLAERLRATMRRRPFEEARSWIATAHAARLAETNDNAGAVRCDRAAGR